MYMVKITPKFKQYKFIFANSDKKSTFAEIFQDKGTIYTNPFI